LSFIIELALDQTYTTFSVMQKNQPKVIGLTFGSY
jgi:hypothetical protein